MLDLTGELQRMAEGAARQARPLTAADVIQRGDRRRRRTITRRSLGGLSVAVVAAAAVLAVTALLPAGSPPNHPAGAQLAAWTVAKQPDGNVAVTIRELRDPAGLQSTLRADGVPASVRFFPSHDRRNPCRAYNAGQGLQGKVVHSLHPGRLRERSIFLIIHPSALPPGAGVGLQVTNSAGDVHRPGDRRLGVALVQASPQCTGS